MKVSNIFGFIMVTGLALVIGATIVGSSISNYHKVLLMVIPGCGACQQSEAYLTQHHVSYTTEQGRSGFFPQLYVDDKYQGTGYEAVKAWVDKNAP